MYDLQRSRFSERFERPVIEGSLIAEEGQLLILADDGVGNAVVIPSAGAADEIPYGFSLTDDARKTFDAAFEELEVPAVAAFTVQLGNRNLDVNAAVVPALPIRVWDVTAAAWLTQVVAPPGAGDFTPDANGLLTFDPGGAEAGHVIQVSYLYNLTAQDIILKYHQQPVSYDAQNFLGTMGIGGGLGTIYTTCYNPLSVDGAGDSWGILPAGTLVSSGADGMLELAGGGGAGAAVGTMIKRPTEDDPWLGVDFSLQLPA